MCARRSPRPVCFCPWGAPAGACTALLGCRVAPVCGAGAQRAGGGVLGEGLALAGHGCAGGGRRRPQAGEPVVGVLMGGVGRAGGAPGAANTGRAPAAPGCAHLEAGQLPSCVQSAWRG